MAQNKFKLLASSFKWQVSKVKPILDDKMAADMTFIISNIPGCVKHNFVINIGDCIYRYFIENNKGLKFIKFTTSISDVVNKAIQLDNLQSVYVLCGIPVLKV